MKRLTIIAISVIILLAGGTAIAQMERPPMPDTPEDMSWWGQGMRMGHGGFWNSPHSKMGLTEEQSKQLSGLKTGHQRKMMELQTQFSEQQTRLRLANTADSYSEKEVNAIASKLSDLTEKRVKLMSKHLRSVRDILTPDQRNIFDQKILSGKKGFGMDKHGKRGKQSSQKCRQKPQRGRR